MNGLQDMGGMHSSSPLPLAAEPWPFAADWERLTISVTLAMIVAGYWTVDESRRSHENTPLDVYAAGKYFERWVHGLGVMLIEKGVATEAEIAAGKSLRDDGVKRPPAPPQAIAFITSNPLPTIVPLDTAPRFKPGDRIVARNFQPKGHTRLPRYVRGKPGTILHYQGAFHLPDANAHGGHDVIEHTWLVRFEGSTLWGEGSERDAVFLTLFDSYIAGAATGD